MRTITVKIPEYLLRMIDRLVEEGLFYSRSDAVREAVRMLVDKYRNSDNGCRGKGSKSTMVMVVAKR
jgi:Arc/MetJ-type ribon-helix-helix transcriptional regulator